MNRTNIGWCTHSCNPVVGCLNGCPYCYARRLAPRVAARLAGATGKPICEACRTYTPHLHPERLPQLREGKGRRVFVGSMCDLWSPGVEQEWRERVFDACGYNQLNTFMVLTKRPDRITRQDRADINQFGIWLGVTVCEAADLWRVQPDLTDTDRHVVSAEPLRGRIPPDGLPAGIAWLIIGPQTGGGAAPPERPWVEELVAWGARRGVPVWLKDACFALWPDMARIQQLPEGMPR